MTQLQDSNQPDSKEADRPQDDKSRRADYGRTRIFVYDLVVIALLILVGALYICFPTYFNLGDVKNLGEAKSKLASLAIQSMWFGALGGTVISLKGIYDHSDGPDGWNASFNLWHIGRPISGAIAGLMTVVLLQVANGSTGQLSEPVVFAAAFIFGTQERRFFNFLYEVARLVVQVPEESKAANLRISGIQPSEGNAGDVVVITGQGIDRNAVVKLGSAAIDKLAVSAEGTSAAGLIPARPMGADTVDVVVANSSGASFVLPNGFKYKG